MDLVRSKSYLYLWNVKLQLLYLIETHIQSFLSYYQETFREATITPKLHILEDHVVPFLRRWKAGFGFFGEQGIKSLHAAFNKIACSYSAITNRVKRLKSIVREHHMQISSALKAQEPPVKRRKRRRTQ